MSTSAGAGWLKSIIEKGAGSYFACIVIMILLPLHNKYIPPFMILWSVLWIIQGFQVKFRNINPKDFGCILFASFILFYLYQSSGILYSTDTRRASLLIFRSLSLLIFPLIMFSPGEKIKKSVRTLLGIFAFATILYILSCFVLAFYRSIYIINGSVFFDPIPPEAFWNNYFSGPHFSYGEHPSYTAMYVIVSILVCFEYWFDKSLKALLRYLCISAGFLLLFSLYFLSSRAGLLAGALILPSYILFKRGRLKQKKIYVISFIVMLAMAVGLLISNQRLIGYYSIDKGFNITGLFSADHRMSYWKSAAGVIKENPVFGVGLGDTCEKLKSEFRRQGFTEGYQENLNAHNQFLEIILNSGFSGLLLFLVILGLMLYKAIADKNLLLGLFVISMVIFFLFETVLNRLAGISFFTLFSFLLLHIKHNQELPVSINNMD